MSGKRSAVRALRRLFRRADPPYLRDIPITHTRRQVIDLTGVKPKERRA